MSPLSIFRSLVQSVGCFALITATSAVVSGAMGQAVISPGEGDQPIVASGEPLASADGLAAALPEPSIVGCGKAEAAQRWFRADPMKSFQRGVAEAMDETDVLHNDLTVEITNINTVANSCTLTGQNRMTIQSKSPALTTFTIRLRNQFSVTGAMINDVTPVTVTTNTTSTRTVTLDRAYGMDEVFTLTIPYTGTTVSAAFGSLEVRNHSGTAVVSTLSEPYYAYTWWPVKDGDVGVPGDNSDKTTLEITVTAPNGFSVASNGVLQSVTPLSGNRNQYYWSSAYPIVTYLVSFAATNYNRWTKNYVHPGGTMPVEFFIYPENDNAAYRAGWEKVTDMMTAFRPLFGEYPFINEKYGLYNFPFGGGMEHQTMTGQSGYSESLTSHELAHQWWGDAVTCKTWSDIWLNEGFATYAECLWEEYKTGVQNQAAYFAAVLSRKPSSVNGSVYVPAASTSDPNRIFSGNFSYLKGGWVLHQLRHVVGDATFFQILNDYRAAYEGSAATTNEFAAVASAAYGQDLTWFFDEWVYQIGAPAYRWGWDSVNVGGQEYLHVKIDQTQSASYPNVFVMPVDLAVTIGAPPSATFTVWNDQRSQYFVLPVTAVPTLVQFDPNQWILRTALTTATLVVGDMNGDLAVNSTDHTTFTNCFTGAGGQLAGGCENADFDGDQDIDCTDWVAFQAAWTAGGTPPEITFCQGTQPVPVSPPPAPHDRRKNRYISFAPSNGAASVAFRIQRNTAPAGSCWVQTPITAAGSDQFTATCGANPVFRAWTEPVIHVGDCEIIPVVDYTVFANSPGPIENPTGLVVSTILPPGGGKLWGDNVGGNNGTEWTPPNGITNVNDVTSLLAFISGAAIRPHFTVANLQAISSADPCLDAQVNAADVLIAVQAYAGASYGPASSTKFTTFAQCAGPATGTCPCCGN